MSGIYTSMVFTLSHSVVQVYQTQHAACWTKVQCREANNDYFSCTSSEGTEPPFCSRYMHLYLLLVVYTVASIGLSINAPDGSEVTAKVRLLMTTLDLPAKALVLNMKQFNGEFGCSYCEDRGEPRPTTHLHRNWPYTETGTQRSHAGMIANVQML